jgi:hypothetical protein
MYASVGVPHRKLYPLSFLSCFFLPALSSFFPPSSPLPSVLIWSPGTTLTSPLKVYWLRHIIANLSELLVDASIQLLMWIRLIPRDLWQNLSYRPRSTRNNDLFCRQQYPTMQLMQFMQFIRQMSSPMIWGKEIAVPWLDSLNSMNSFLFNVMLIWIEALDPLQRLISS